MVSKIILFIVGFCFWLVSLPYGIYTEDYLTSVGFIVGGCLIIYLSFELPRLTNRD